MNAPRTSIPLLHDNTYSARRSELLRTVATAMVAIACAVGGLAVGRASLDNAAANTAATERVAREAEARAQAARAQAERDGDDLRAARATPASQPTVMVQTTAPRPASGPALRVRSTPVRTHASEPSLEIDPMEGPDPFAYDDGAPASSAHHSTARARGH